MEFLADRARDGKKVGWFACDNMSRIPLVVDACSHVFARNHRHTRTSDDRDFYDHNLAVGRRLLIEVSGIMSCKIPHPVTLVEDENGCSHLPRPRPDSMSVFLHAVPDIPSSCAQYLHW